MIRRLRRIGYAVGGAVLFLNVLMNARVVGYLLVILMNLEPELRDSQAASLAVTKAILSQVLADTTQAYQAQLEISRRAYEIELPEDQLLQLDEDLAKAHAAMTDAWLEWAIVA